MSKRWTIFLGIGVVTLGLIVAVVVAEQRQESGRRAAEVAATSTTGVTSPYDLTELPADSDLNLIEEASFASITVPVENDKLTSYGVGSGRPAMQALTEAIRDAEEIGEEAASLPPTDTDSTITFVLPSRQTLTFNIDLETGLIARGSRVWRPQGDLAALVGAATTGPN
ncbi:MAG: hypothetical protein V1912_04215 [bacterium]